MNETEITRRGDGIARVSTLTAALALAGVLGTGAVVYAVANHAATSNASSSWQSNATTGTSSTVPAPTTTQQQPIVTSHGS
jgi:hypothetical protein